MKGFLSIAELSPAAVRSLLAEAVRLKKEGWINVLDKKILGLVFEKPSLRTRVSFEVAMKQLGGHAIYLSPAEIGLGKRESAADVARVLSRYVDILAARTFSHKTVEDLAQYGTIPVINALSDYEHPCQALADILTIQEKKGSFQGLTMAYIGDGNNVASSLLLACVMTGINFRIANPAGYAIPAQVMAKAEEFAAATGSRIEVTDNPQVAAREADIIYTDVWTSMGQEAEAEERRRVFQNYQVNDDLLSVAGKDVIVMHPLPAHHGEEIAAGITDGPHSVVFDEAENRLHIQKAIILWLMTGKEDREQPALKHG